MIEILNIQNTKEHKGLELMYGYYDVLAKLPDNATNGDMIKAMFPNELLTSITGTLWLGDNMSFNKEWWNAPYQRGGEE